jgi:hypothetical protein
MAYSRINSLKIDSLKIDSLKFACTALLIVIGSLCAGGQVLRGNVTDGTTKKPAAADDVILLKLDKGMTEEARTKSNARGEFSFQMQDSQVMHAVRVVHEKVSYYQPVMPGSASVTVTVYESEPTVQGVHRTDQSVVFQAKGGTLQVYELFDVRNDSQPPKTQPTFSFYLPDGATVQSGEALREQGMPLKSAPVPQEEKGKYLFMYPLNPGLTHFEVVYSLPYTGAFKYQPRFAGALDKFYVVTPKSMGFTTDNPSQYQTAAAWPVDAGVKDIDVHVAANTGQGAQLAFNVTGEGVLQQDQAPQQSASGGQAGQAAPGRQAENEGPGGGMGIPNERPNPLSSGQWGFLGVLTLFLAGGGAFVYMVSGNSGASPAAASQHKHPASLLDALKEEMFQLEADRLQGKINPQEYTGAKAVLDKTLQRAMKKGK